MCSTLNPNWEAVKTPLDDCTSATVSADPARPVTYRKPPHKRLIDQGSVDLRDWWKINGCIGRRCWYNHSSYVSLWTMIMIQYYRCQTRGMRPWTVQEIILSRGYGVKRPQAKREGHKGMTLVRFGLQLRNLGIIFTPALLIRWSGYSIHAFQGFMGLLCTVKFNLIY